MESEILLETGTNEAEFLEFYLNDQSFAINVAKVVQIIPFNEDDLTRTAGGPDSAMGSLLWRDRTIDLINLYIALNYKEKEEPLQPVVLVTNFNNVTCGFRIQGVNRIHRVNWNEIKPVDALLDRFSPRFTGSITIAEKNILLVDFEKLISDMFMAEEQAEIRALQTETDIHELRGKEKIIFAEDSNLIRKNLTNYLQTAGYQIFSHENGQYAWDFISKLKQQAGSGDMSDSISLIITDIEMPQMDGLTLCRKLKEDPQLSQIPVIIFSSLINEQMALKCKEVGADGYLAKPRSKDLIDKVDDLLLK